MDHLQSIYLLLRGVLRRFLLWLPLIVLDRLDAMAFYSQFVKPYLPPMLQRIVAVPLENLLILTLALISWAGVLTYHQLRMSTRVEIAELKHRAALEVAVDIPQGLQLMRPSAAGPIEANGWMLFLQSVRITNRSATSHVSLGITVHLRLLDNTRSLPRLSVREDSDAGLWKWSMPQGLPQYLRSPLNIPPGQTVQGMMGFWVPPFIEDALGVKELDAAIARRGDPIYGTRDAQLEVIDYVSGEMLTVAVPGGMS